MEFHADGTTISPSSKYVPKLVELLTVGETRGKRLPHHSTLELYDLENLAIVLDDEGTVCRLALGVCLYLAQERIDVQRCVRLLATHMGKPSAAVMVGLQKLANYLVYFDDVNLECPKVEVNSSILPWWNGDGEKRDGKTKNSKV